jgi:hypothetical protein
VVSSSSSSFALVSLSSSPPPLLSSVFTVVDCGSFVSCKRWAGLAGFGKEIGVDYKVDRGLSRASVFGLLLRLPAATATVAAKASTGSVRVVVAGKHGKNEAVDGSDEVVFITAS